MNRSSFLLCAAAGSLLLAASIVPAAPPVTTATESVSGLEAEYTAQIAALRAEIARGLPQIDPRLVEDFRRARAEVKESEVRAAAAKTALGKVHTAKALVDHAKGKWIGGAEKGIAGAQAALGKASTESQRDAARADLAKWQKNKQDGLAALAERQAAYEQLKKDEPQLARADSEAAAAVARAREGEMLASKALLALVAPVTGSDMLDASLLRCVVLVQATPRGLADFAAQAPGNKALVDALLEDTVLLRSMLEAGGAKFGKYGEAMAILDAIGKADGQPTNPTLRRLALATSLEHARPIPRNNTANDTNAPATVDPVKRYQHYARAFEKGELDLAFQHLSVWEMRHVVNSDAPDEILAWGRQMLRTYRPDHIYNPDYGWRYVASVRTEVTYGSQNVKDDLPSLHQFQNIMMNGGVCGRRAFFGRFILRSFGIPTWGVTQKAHAALSHWTPKGWVINLGAGFENSWWDKDEAPRSGSDFLLETQARAHGDAYTPVLRARWVSLAMGEPAYNDRTGVEGGLWSRLAHLKSVSLASSAVALGPLGSELAEANEAREKQMLAGENVRDEDRRIVPSSAGGLVIPAVAHSRTSGKFAAMKSFGPGMQIHATAGYKGEIEVDVSGGGTYLLSARVATVQKSHAFTVTANGSSSPIPIPVVNTVGKWELTAPVELELKDGPNTLAFQAREGSKGVTIKEYLLSPKK